MRNIEANLELLNRLPFKDTGILWYMTRNALLLAAELAAAINTHRSQKADDRCWQDDDRLYAVLGDDIKCDRRVGCKTAMLENCKRFIDQRCEGGGWRSYAELEAENARLREELEKVATCLKCGFVAGGNPDYYEIP